MKKTLIEHIKSIFLKETKQLTKEEVLNEISKDEHLDINDIRNIMQNEEDSIDRKGIINKAIKEIDERLKAEARIGNESTSVFIDRFIPKPIVNFPSSVDFIINEIKSHYVKKGFEVRITYQGSSYATLRILWSKL